MIPDPSGQAPVSVLVVDDHPVVRAGLRFSLSTQAGFSVCGEAENADDALALAALHAPRLVILDLNLSGRDADRTVSLLRRQCPGAAILVFSMNPEELFARRTIEDGANGYLMKTDGFEELHRAVGRILAGEVYLSPRMAGRNEPAGPGGAAAGGGVVPGSLVSLTARELQIFQRIGEGRGTAEIATELGLSIKTVSAHRENVKRKLGAPTAAELIRQAVAWVLGRDKSAPRTATADLRDQG